MLLGRKLADEELRRVPFGDGLTESQVEIISYLAYRHITYGCFYLRAVVPGIQFFEAQQIVYRIFNEPKLLAVPPWSLQAGVGRWRFRIADPADPLETVRRMASSSRTTRRRLAM